MWNLVGLVMTSLGFRSCPLSYFFRKKHSSEESGTHCQVSPLQSQQGSGLTFLTVSVLLPQFRGRSASSPLHAAVPGFGSEPCAGEVDTEVTAGSRPPPPGSPLQLQPLSWCQQRRRQRSAVRERLCSGTVPGHGAPPPDRVPNETDRTEAAGPGAADPAGTSSRQRLTNLLSKTDTFIVKCLLSAGQTL